jgi:hypothetical protein
MKLQQETLSLPFSESEKDYWTRLLYQTKSLILLEYRHEVEIYGLLAKPTHGNKNCFAPPLVLQKHKFTNV